MEKKDDRLMIETALLMGKILLENGAEISRVEDTVERMMRKSLGVKSLHSYFTYVTLTGIFVKTNLDESSFLRIDIRCYNLEKIVAVNQISRDYHANKLTLLEMRKALKKLEQDKSTTSTWQQLAFTALLSGSIILIFKGHISDLPSSMAAGMLSYCMFQKLSSVADYPFILEFISTFCGGLLGYFIYSFIGMDVTLTMMGAVMPLVPGIGITNAIRDLMSRDYLSGMIRLFESLFIAAALGCGVALVFLIFNY